MIKEAAICQDEIESNMQKMHIAVVANFATVQSGEVVMNLLSKEVK
ncbi:MAG: hypothetical protein LBG75_02435 [Candidatus Nomurabacteria bacterium]|jgi:hypothetical protein|nr:hypothetical protein [Candidatus Nomurabacteria bacterium]